MTRRSRLISGLVLFVFTLPNVSFAFEASVYQPKAPLARPGASLTANGSAIQIAPKLGRIVGSYQNPAGRTILFIHDLHCNYEVQSNIAGMLEFLAKNHGLSLIGVEGDSGPIDVSKLASFPVAKVRENVGQYFLKRGRITGAEYLAATGPWGLQLEGIESPALYRQDKEILMKFLNEESQGYCEDIKTSLGRLKEPLYSLELAKLDHLREQFLSENVILETYCTRLLSEAQHYGIALKAFPVLSVYAVEHRLPQTADADYDQLVADADALDAAVRDKLYTSPEQRQLDHYLRLAAIAEHMLNISATAADLEYYRAHRAEFKIKSLLDFLDTAGYRNGLDLALDPGAVKLGDSLSQAAHFYDVADERSGAFVDNMLKIMESKNQRLAVMITGGFHSRKVEDALRGRKVSYLTIKPSILRPDVENPYFSLLHNRREPLEQLLAKTQNIFAPSSGFNDIVLKRYMDAVLKIDLRRYLSSELHLTGAALEERNLQAVNQYKENEAAIQLDASAVRGNLDQNVYVFALRGTEFSVIVRKEQMESAKPYPVVAEEALAADYKFQIVENSVLKSKEYRANILGGRTQRVAAQTVGDLLQSILAEPGRLQRLAAQTSSWTGPMVERLNSFVRGRKLQLPDPRIAASIQWAKQYGYGDGVPLYSSYSFRQTLMDMLDRAKESPELDYVIRSRPTGLALLAMAWEQGLNPAAPEQNPEDNIIELAQSLHVGDKLAARILSGQNDPVKLKAERVAELKAQGNSELEAHRKAQAEFKASYLGQLLDAVAAGKKEFTLGVGEIIFAGMLPEAFTRDQVLAIGRVVRANKVKLTIQGPKLNPWQGFHPKTDQVAAAYQRWIDLAGKLRESMGAVRLQGPRGLLEGSLEEQLTAYALAQRKTQQVVLALMDENQTQQASSEGLGATILPFPTAKPAAEVAVAAMQEGKLGILPREDALPTPRPALQRVGMRIAGIGATAAAILGLTGLLAHLPGLDTVLQLGIASSFGSAFQFMGIALVWPMARLGLGTSFSRVASRTALLALENSQNADEALAALRLLAAAAPQDAPDLTITIPNRKPFALTLPGVSAYAVMRRLSALPGISFELNKYPAKKTRQAIANSI